MNRKTQGCLHGSNTTAMTPYYTYKTQEKKVFISLKLWPWQPSLRNRKEWSISLSWAALDHQMWLARDCYNILFFLWTKYYKLCLLVLVLPTQFSGFCSYWMMHFYCRGHACFPASRRGIHSITWSVISSGSSAFCLLSQLKYRKSSILQCCCDLVTQMTLTA